MHRAVDLAAAGSRFYVRRAPSVSRVYIQRVWRALGASAGRLYPIIARPGRVDTRVANICEEPSQTSGRK